MKSPISAVVALVLVLMPVGVSSLAAGEPAGPVGLVGRWAFDDGTGKDLSGNGNDAVLAGGTV